MCGRSSGRLNSRRLRLAVDIELLLGWLVGLVGVLVGAGLALLAHHNRGVVLGVLGVLVGVLISLLFSGIEGLSLSILIAVLGVLILVLRVDDVAALWQSASTQQPRLENADDAAASPRRRH